VTVMPPTMRVPLPVVFCLLLFAAPAGSHDGDINLDSAVDVADLLWGLQTLQGSRTLMPAEACHADVSPLVSGAPAPDGLFNPGDVVVLLRMLLEDLHFGTSGNQFNIGDSIGEGEAADNTIGEARHETVWSTGYDGGDDVNSLNERFDSIPPDVYYENNAASGASREDPDMIYPGDGSDCVRRKQFHAAIRDTCNPILRTVVQEYRDTGKLPNVRYPDILDVYFESADVNSGDCFHPSEDGHALLAENEWSRTHRGLAACP